MAERALDTRWRLFLSYLAVILPLVAVLSLAIRSIGIRAVSAHMMNMPGSSHMSQMMTEDLERAITAGLNQAVLWSGLSAIGAALIASLLVSGWIMRPLRHMAEVSTRIANGKYSERVAYEASDEIGRFAAAFNNMASKLQKTEEVRRELLGTISHEIRTPLANIQGYMQGLMDGVVPAGMETYDLVRREAARLSRLVSDVERLSRLEAGGEIIQPQVLDVRQTLETAVSSLCPIFLQSGVSLELRPPATQLEMWADPDKVAQIMGNLLSNSLRYTSPGGRVLVTARAKASMIEVAVEDDGIGIPADDLPHVFERFYRVDRSRSQGGGGSGIGLAVVKALVEQMGGSVRAESDQGVFTRFTFTLPRRPAA